MQKGPGTGLEFSPTIPPDQIALSPLCETGCLGFETGAWSEINCMIERDTGGKIVMCAKFSPDDLITVFVFLSQPLPRADPYFVTTYLL